MATPPTFTSGSILTAAQMNSVGLWKIGDFTASGSSRALVCDNVFTSNYEKYRVVVSMRSTANLNGMYFQYINSAGSTVTGSYYGTAYGQDFASGTTGFAVAPSTGAHYIGWVPNGSTLGLASYLDITEPASSSLVTHMNGQFTGILSGSQYLAGTCYGMMTVTTAMRGLRFDNDAGTNLTGKVTVYGYR